MRLPSEIQQSLSEAKDLVANTQMKLSLVEEHFYDAGKRDRLSRALLRLKQIELEARVRLEKDRTESEEQNHILLENTQLLIAKLRDVEKILEGEIHLARVLDLLESICPLWPFC